MTQKKTIYTPADNQRAKTLEEKAQAYAEKELVRTIRRHAHPLDHLAPYFDSKDIQQAYLAGATEALASQWVSVRDGLPEDRQQIIYRYRWRNPKTGIWHDSGIDACRYVKDFGFRTDNENVLCWLPIPPLKGGDE